MELLFTTEMQWLNKWDHFVKTNDCGSHLLLSEWLRSFERFGFQFEVALLVDNDTIVGGYGAIVAKAAIFRFYIVPFGPIVINGAEENLDQLINSVQQRARHHDCCYCHVTLPFTEVLNRHTSKPREIAALRNARKGHLFKFVYSSSGLNWIDLHGFTNEEQLLESFRPSVRRYIRSSLRKGLNAKLLETPHELKLGYELCLQNAAQNNYSLRSWDSFKGVLHAVVADGTGQFIGAFKDGELKGAALIMRAGNYNTYILGGTVKQKPDLLVGHFLHWTAIKSSFAAQLSGYNISLGGSEGVIAFKNSYANQQIMFTGKYHWVLRPMLFKTYLLIEKTIKPYKSTIAKIFSKKN